MDKDLKKKGREEKTKPRSRTLRRLCRSATRPKMKEERRVAAEKTPIMTPISREEAPRVLANTGMKSMESTFAMFARNWILLIRIQKKHGHEVYYMYLLLDIRTNTGTPSSGNL
ncbi:MAG: hypothetical protein PHV51_02250 [Methanosarcinaceae archaeon]|nr:hypothetical protein [Methanosarcinaceae archaeon]